MTERAILKAIGFDFNSQHPYRYVVSYVKSLGGSQELLQIAWNWVNDSLKTTLCLHYRPEQIASAAVLLSAKLMRSHHYKNAIEHPEELFCEEKLDVLEGECSSSYYSLFTLITLFPFFPSLHHHRNLCSNS
jgi:hypothetical protein